LSGSLKGVLEAALGSPVVSIRPLGGGCIGEVREVGLADGRRLVAKSAQGAPAGSLELEAWMIDYLARHSALPLPEVVHAREGLLVLSYIEGGAPMTAKAEEHAAELLAALHGVEGSAFGLERDTLIGALPQPNPPTPHWTAFFAEQRLIAFGRLALSRGRIKRETFGDLERLAGNIERYLEEPRAPALIHGDCWSGNLIVGRDCIAGFIDPAIYYAHPEVELAFTTLFGTFGESFFARYQELRPIAPGFFELRCQLYNLYPLLVHAILFGGSYARSVERTLQRLL
jgi:fructosamine-3-kinase